MYIVGKVFSLLQLKLHIEEDPTREVEAKLQVLPRMGRREDLMRNV